MHDRWQRLNLLALVFAVAIVAALGLAWWRDRARTYEQPRWDAAQFVMVAPESTRAEGQRWVVAVNLACPHCQQHLREIARRIEPRRTPPALAALIVDQRERPDSLDLGVRLAGGAWWDSSQVWREAWGRRAYGETFRFDASGSLLSSTPVGVVPDSADVVM